MCYSVAYTHTLHLDRMYLYMLGDHQSAQRKLTIDFRSADCHVQFNDILT